MKIIYDFGANEGQNLNYYLTKADLVVAVEANPILTNKIKEEFQIQIKEGKLIVINNCLVDKEIHEEVNFYLNNLDSGLSSFIAPHINSSDYEIIKVNPITYSEIVGKFGTPYYVKIDLEGLDNVIINSILQSKIIPIHLSFENSVDYTKDIIHSLSDFKSFNLVSFYNYSTVYGKNPHKTAGPFDNDIKSPWLDKENISQLIKQIPSTWYDVHICTLDLKKGNIDLSFYKKEFNLVLQIKELVPPQISSYIKKLINK